MENHSRKSLKRNGNWIYRGQEQHTYLYPWPIDHATKNRRDTTFANFQYGALFKEPVITYLVSMVSLMLLLSTNDEHFERFERLFMNMQCTFLLFNYLLPGFKPSRAIVKFHKRKDCTYSAQ